MSLGKQFDNLLHQFILLVLHQKSIASDKVSSALDCIDKALSLQLSVGLLNSIRIS